MNIEEALDAIYDAKTGRFRNLGGEPVTPNNLPREGDLVYWPGRTAMLGIPTGNWTNDSGGGAVILRRRVQPEPDLIYFPWPSGIDGIIGVIGPRGNIPCNVKWDNFDMDGGRDTGLVHDGVASQRVFNERGESVTFRFPTDADLTWIRSEDEVPPDLLAEAKTRETSHA